MNEIILHHYPQSPVSEKVRVALGLKDLAWRSVEIPRLPPKPDLMPLTGGYRRTPVLQIGADIYCDSHCILRALERRYPEPSFFPNGCEGLAWSYGRWTDGDLFDLSVRLVLGAAAETLPQDFAQDRGRLYLGPDANLHKVKADLPHIIAQIRAQIRWIDQRLELGSTYLFGSDPSLPDALTYYFIWFIRGRWDRGPAFLSEFPALEAWESRVKALGHGQSKDLSSREALSIARAAEPTSEEYVDPKDPQRLASGMEVLVCPEVDGGDPQVRGTVHFADRDTLGILHREEAVGRVCIHFPRVGYRVIPI